MDTTRVKLEEVRRGSLIPTGRGFVVADGIAHTWDDDPRMFMRDTEGGQHFPDDGGCITVGIPGFRADAVGELTGRHTARHILLNEVPGQPPAGYCPRSRNLGERLQVWSSGTALAGVTCGSCRTMTGLVGTYGTRKSTGI
jgi:hypothetical protein